MHSDTSRVDRPFSIRLSMARLARLIVVSFSAWSNLHVGSKYVE
jgi:hypothetical protein